MTQDLEDLYVFKVPSLRNVLDTAPYFHDGSISTIEDAIQIMAKVQLGRDISKQDIQDIKALFESFTGSLNEQ